MYCIFYFSLSDLQLLVQADYLKVQMIRRVLIDLNTVIKQNRVCMFVIKRDIYWTDFTCCKWWNNLADIKSYTGINLCSLLIHKRDFGFSNLNRPNFANDTFRKRDVKSTLSDCYEIGVNLNTSIGNKETKVRFTYFRVFRKTNVEIFKCFLRQER